jgi:hypothetical protein
MYEKLVLWLVFMLGGTLGYRGTEPILAIFVVTTLLTLPRLVRDGGARALSLTMVISGANALIFAGAAYAIGRGLAWLAT